MLASQTANSCTVHNGDLFSVGVLCADNGLWLLEMWFSEPLSVGLHCCITSNIRSAYRSILLSVCCCTVLRAVVSARITWNTLPADIKCHSLFSNICGVVNRLQSVQNAAARLVTGTRRSDHISPVLRQLHWLPAHQRVNFKVATLVHQSLSSISPRYLADDCRLVADARERRLRSTASQTCVVTRTYSTFGDRAFGAAGPGLWNSLPSHLKTLTYHTVNSACH